MTDAIVIVGGGHAAAQLCSVLAQAGQGHRVHVICEEAVHPYHRPPLSKSYLKSELEGLQLHRDAAWYADAGISIHLADAAVSVDRTSRKVTLASGRELSYANLVLATGTRARSLPALDGGLSNVATLRTAADAASMRERLKPDVSGELAVIGGGFIGLEVASTARQLGWSVRVFEAAPRLLARAVSNELSAHVVEHHRQMGIDIVLGATVGNFETDGGRLVTLHVNGELYSVDTLLLGIGAVPEVMLAREAGLELDNGVRVDGAMRTSDPAILAIGDCSSFEYRGKRIRLESVQNAIDQAKTAAATLLSKPADYKPTPLFWSDQGGVKLQMVGLWREGLLAVRRQGATPGSFSLFHYDQHELVCVESVNAPVDHMWSRKLLDRGVSPLPSQATDSGFTLKTLI
jgi:3-phenylpropionate/trans-cinnamate dioxygenase ferredoxin reductase subunit